ncbi:MAG: hypothetical protein ACO363_09185, partial [Balneolaceae bacterium]
VALFLRLLHELPSAESQRHLLSNLSQQHRELHRSAIYPPFTSHPLRNLSYASFITSFQLHRSDIFLETIAATPGATS